MTDPLLVVVDMQELFRDPTSPWLIPRFDELVGPIGRLVAAFGGRVAYTRFEVPDVPLGSWGPYYETFASVTDPANAAWFELAEPYRHGARHVIGRPVFDAWGARMRALAGEPPTIVLCGVATDCCVISTALPAADAGAFVRVVGDACRGSSDASHAAAIRVLSGYAPQIAITTVEDELAARAALTP